MALRILVDGYFRSGTSIVWKVLKESNLDKKVFYEPCHRELFHNIRNEINSTQEHAVHGFRLWEEYYSVTDASFLERIRWKHPNVNRSFPECQESLLSYVTEFDRLDKDVCMQTNRWHFSIYDIYREFGNYTLFMVRNPFKVYDSMKVYYYDLKNNSYTRYFIKKCVSRFIQGKVFHLGEMYEYIHDRYPANDVTTIIVREAYGIQLFFVTWIISNYVGIRQTLESGGDVFRLDKIMSCPHKLKNRIEDRTGFNFNWEGILRTTDREIPLNPKERKVMIKMGEDLGLQEEVDFLMNYLV